YLPDVGAAVRGAAEDAAHRRRPAVVLGIVSEPVGLAGGDDHARASFLTEPGLSGPGHSGPGPLLDLEPAPEAGAARGRRAHGATGPAPERVGGARGSG